MATGINIARAFSNNLIYSIYLGRLFNLLAYSILIYFSIKMIPAKKMTMLVIALMPTQFLLSSSFSIDSVVLGSVCLFISYLLKLQNNEHISIKESLLLVLAALGVIICKTISYIPIVMLVLLLKKMQFKSLKHYYTTISSVVLFSLIYIIINLKLVGAGITDDRAASGTNSRFANLIYIKYSF